MLDAYRSSDAYLAFAKQAQAVPADATKGGHANIRELYKRCALGVIFGMGAETLAKPRNAQANLFTRPSAFCGITGKRTRGSGAGPME
jgi:hypothetical protein